MTSPIPHYNFYNFPRIAITTHPFQAQQPSELSFDAHEYLIIFDELDSGYCECVLLGKYDDEASKPLNDESKETDGSGENDEKDSAATQRQQNFASWVETHLKTIYSSDSLPEDESPATSARGYVSMYFVNYVNYHKFDGITRKDPRNEYEDYYRGLTCQCVKCNKVMSTFEEKWHTWDVKDMDMDWGSKGINYCAQCYEHSVTEHGSIKELVELSGGAEKLRPDAHFFSWRKHPGEIQYLLVASSTAQSLDNAFREYENRHCYGWRISNHDSHGATILTDNIQWISFGEVRQQIRNFSSGLIDNIRHLIRSDWDIDTRPMIGICSVNRSEWFIADLSCMMYGLVSVPLPRNKVLCKDKGDIVHMINHAKLEVIVSEKKYMSEYLDICAAHCPSVRMIIQMEDWDNYQLETLQKVAPSSIHLFNLNDVMKKGRKILKENDSLEPVSLPADALLTIVYTSGSTNRPKGVVLTEKNMRDTFNTENFQSYHPLVTLSFHPLSHISDRQSALVTVIGGGQVGIFSGDMENIYDDLRVFAPILLSTTPRLINRLYSEYQKETLIAKSQSKSGVVDEVKLRKKFKYALGDRIQCMTLGGAATSKQVISFSKRVFEIPVYVGYASTEAGSICWLEESSDYHTEAFKKSDSNMKLIDCPELNYFTTNDPPQGEICVKSQNVFSGYYKDEQQTKSAFTEDGFFKTGDIGEKTKNGYRIIDRKSNAVKLAQGEFIVTSRLEEIFVQSVFVDQVFIYGDSMHSFPVAVVIPQKEAVNQWSIQNGLIEEGSLITFPSVTDDLTAQKEQFTQKVFEKLHCALLNDFQRIGMDENKLQAYEIPGGILLDNEPFTDENRRLTGTHKICHPELKKHYIDQINGLYNLLETRQPEEILLTALGEVLGIDMHSEESASKYASCTFSDLGGDSLTASKLNNIIGMSSLEIPSYLLLKKDLTLTDLRRYVKQITTFDLEHEITLSSEFDVTNLPASPAMSTLTSCAKYILLTGSTGFMGGHLLSSIMSRFTSLKTLYCLVRGGSEQECQQRLERCLADRGIRNLPRDIFCVVCGDLALPKLGLSEDMWNELAERVSVVFHNGALVNAAFSYNDLKKTNVDGTLEILRLCGSKQVKHLHFTSTVGVLGGRTDTDGPPTYPQELDGYSLSKFVAEKLLERARSSRGFPVTIFRPELVSGDSSTGFLNASDWFTILMRGCIQCGYYPQEDWRIQSIPVDYCCHALVGLACLDTSTNQTIHLVNPLDDQCSITVSTLFEYINDIPESGLTPVQPLSFAAWLAHVKSLRSESSAHNNPMVRSLALYERGFSTEVIHYSTGAKLLLQQCIIDRKCPAVNTNRIVSKYVRAMQKMELIQGISGGVSEKGK